MEETISLKELLDTLKKRLWLILSITFVAVLASGIVSYFFLTPIYQASTQILVNQKQSEQAAYNPSVVQTNLQLINTYNGIIKSNRILDIVIEDMDLNMTAEQLKGSINVGSETNSQIVNISVQNADKKLAVDIANKIANVFSKEVVVIFSVDNVSVLAEATDVQTQSPIKPKPPLNIAIALVVGLMAGVGLAFLLEYLDNTVKSAQDIEKQLGMPVLGVISVIDEKQMAARKQKRGQRQMERGESGV
ncbi:capsular biosynthesis protein [Mesobacillus boroniphilus]|uniref:Capsular biosynthesis protein n=1 Tax=Mesobacillus boroniphilus TaxID=308892 RepID=A0A944CN61_9BACI|nr:Wzz/FepE/Etk N-terminal domain-containing protein [Mesobacillus boroniphilus]MBS8265625.1 capsular biosynthesis protein [Mesobacillus boroniphilus]